MHNIPTQLLQATINYLAKQPWAETNDLITALRSLPLIEEPAPALPKKDTVAVPEPKKEEKSAKK
uniref:Uncharacterized protein n=1 Tax=viral metagenome TaxID=1070528 RepID=A0A6M3IJI6_9ZZZZ